MTETKNPWPFKPATPTPTPCEDTAHCRCPGCLADDVVLAEMAAETPARCPRCEHPHGTCHLTAAPIAVGDTIDADMVHGRWVRATELRPNSRVKDAEGSVWVRTRHRDLLWERIENAPGCSGPGHPIWELWPLVDERQGYGPLTVVHVAGRKTTTTPKES